MLNCIQVFATLCLHRMNRCSFFCAVQRDLHEPILYNLKCKSHFRDSEHGNMVFSVH